MDLRRCIWATVKSPRGLPCSVSLGGRFTRAALDVWLIYNEKKNIKTAKIMKIVKFLCVREH